MCVGNNTSHARRADFSVRNRGLPCVQSSSKKRLCHFFDSLKHPAGCFFFAAMEETSTPIEDGAAQTRATADLPWPAMLSRLGGLIKLVDFPNQAVQAHGQLSALVAGEGGKGGYSPVFHLVIDAGIHGTQILPQLGAFAQGLRAVVND